MIEEIWRDVINYEGLYQVSNMGRVRSLDRWITYKDGREALFKGKILHLNCNTSGYLEVHLCKQSKGKMIGVHRLVAQSFIDNVDNLPEVDHIDGDKTNNNVTNLRWVTHLDNCNNPSTTKNISKANSGKNNGMYGKTQSENVKQKVREANSKKVICVETGKVYSSIKEAEEDMGVSMSSIGKCCSGKNKTCKGYHWAYYKEEVV